MQSPLSKTENLNLKELLLDGPLLDEVAAAVQAGVNLESEPQRVRFTTIAELEEYCSVMHQVLYEDQTTTNQAKETTHKVIDFLLKSVLFKGKPLLEYQDENHQLDVELVHSVLSKLFFSSPVEVTQARILRFPTGEEDAPLAKLSKLGEPATLPNESSQPLPNSKSPIHFELTMSL